MRTVERRMWTRWLQLSVVLLQPLRAGTRKPLLSETFARRAVQLEPKNAIAWDRLECAAGAWPYSTMKQRMPTGARWNSTRSFQWPTHTWRACSTNGTSRRGPTLYERATQLAKDPATLNLIAESLAAEQQWQNSEPVLKRALRTRWAKSDRALLEGPDAGGF